MDLPIVDGLVVSLHYRLSLSDGTVVYDSSDGDPPVYVHGGGSLVPGLERGLAGKRAGEDCRIVVEPVDGYGLRNPAGDLSVPLSQVPPGLDLEPGQSFRVGMPGGSARVWVVGVRDDVVLLSNNHPLAGERLLFDVRVLEVREGTYEERNPPDT